MTSTLMHKPNMMYFSKEATSKDTILKTQLLLLAGDEKKADIEVFWRSDCWFYN